MQPKSKEQRKVSQIVLRPLTNRENRQAETNCFYHFAHYNGKTAQCSECGNVWQLGSYNKKIAVCPHCGKRLKVERTNKRHFVQIAYFSVVQRHQEYQVFRYFLIKKRMKKGTATQYETHEICRKFYNTTNEKITIFAKSYLSYWFYRTIPFDIFSPFSVQREYTGYHKRYSFPTSCNIVASLHPTLKKQGFCGNLCNCSVKDFFTRLKIPAFETLLKQRQFSAFSLLRADNVQQFFPSIKVAYRHGYKINDFPLWQDLLTALQFCGKDTHNPKFICPDDLKTAHDFWCKRQKILREKKRLAESLAMAKLKENDYQKAKGAFFGIALKGKNLIVTPLKSVQEFALEGSAMHHCVYSCSYYAKPNSLILSAKDEQNNRLATIEVALDTMTIRQCRAACNTIPERDKEIRTLIQNNMHLIRAASA